MAGLATSAAAQQTMKFTIQNGKMVNSSGAPPAAGNTSSQMTQGQQLEVSREQQYMLAALSALMQGDFAKAEDLYSQVIQYNPANSEAWLQRAVVRRETQNAQGMAVDARRALSQLNAEIQASPRNGTLYHQRSVALRLLKSFDLAKKDLLTAMQLKGKSSVSFQNDLQAIELERRMASAAR
ncbi:MAG: tetratricopeptide repeat protein [Alphaproteobacteria bacterium]